MRLGAGVAIASVFAAAVFRPAGTVTVHHASASGDVGDGTRHGGRRAGAVCATRRQTGGVPRLW
ncbi:exported hypothetical protein [Candidatus Sulfopaludibacter sp. SbA4]|nr:exported hypothetical protein [Candidatus Sulfopaludibacter sp. SbA4]